MIDQVIGSVWEEVVAGLVIVVIVAIGVASRKLLLRLFRKITSVLRRRCYMRQQRKIGEHNEREDRRNEWVVVVDSDKRINRHRACVSEAEVFESVDPKATIPLNVCVCGGDVRGPIKHR